MTAVCVAKSSSAMEMLKGSEILVLSLALLIGESVQVDLDFYYCDSETPCKDQTEDYCDESTTTCKACADVCDDSLPSLKRLCQQKCPKYNKKQLEPDPTTAVPLETTAELKVQGNGKSEEDSESHSLATDEIVIITILLHILTLVLLGGSVAFIIPFVAARCKKGDENSSIKSESEGKPDTCLEVGEIQRAPIKIFLQHHFR